MIYDRLTLCSCVCKIIHAHGGLRKAARALGIDAGYLQRLSVGTKIAPSNAMLNKLGISKEIRYYLNPRP